LSCLVSLRKRPRLYPRAIYCLKFIYWTTLASVFPFHLNFSVTGHFKISGLLENQHWSDGGLLGSNAVYVRLWTLAFWRDKLSLLSVWCIVTWQRARQPKNRGSIEGSIKKLVSFPKCHWLWGPSKFLLNTNWLFPPREKWPGCEFGTLRLVPRLRSGAIPPFAHLALCRVHIGTILPLFSHNSSPIRQRKSLLTTTPPSA
jgi:hypothetical protein